MCAASQRTELAQEPEGAFAVMGTPKSGARVRRRQCLMSFSEEELTTSRHKVPSAIVHWQVSGVLGKGSFSGEAVEGKSRHPLGRLGHSRKSMVRPRCEGGL